VPDQVSTNKVIQAGGNQNNPYVREAGRIRKYLDRNPSDDLRDMKIAVFSSCPKLQPGNML